MIRKASRFTEELNSRDRFQKELQSRRERLELIRRDEKSNTIDIDIEIVRIVDV